MLTLPADLDNSNKVLQLARTTIKKGNASPGIMDALASLECGHARLMTKAEALYSSLNVHDQFPELKNISLDFVQILLMARDLKINICKRAVGTFFEWDKLNHAVGGKDRTSLGTKLHQQTWKAIVKCQPALMAAIRKYNHYCEQLSQLHDPSCAIALPSPLPTTVTNFQNDPTLMQDIWITPSVGEVPQWLKDTDMQDGIHALIKTERCVEEQHRLGLEADNMCCWFGYELPAIHIALQQSESKFSHHRNSLN